MPEELGDPVERLLAEILLVPDDEQSRALTRACRDHPHEAAALMRSYSILRGAGLHSDPGSRAAFALPERLGEFRLIERLGGGGMGVVWLAEQEALGRQVALKIVRPEQLYFPEARERFRRETQAVARLQHPGIVAVFAVGEQDGLPYYAMERIRGCTLAEVLKSVEGQAPETLNGSAFERAVAAAAGEEPSGAARRSFDGSWVDCCLRLVRQAAEAIDHAHRREILHRDLKPSNIALSIDGRVILLDFGLSSAEGSERMTRTGSHPGTLLYMSPEQLRGARGRVDPRTDVYSLGVTLYELLALQPPFRGADPVETQAQILAGKPDPLRARNRRVPIDAETVCFKAMERDAASRYASAADFARDLDHVLAKQPIEARPPGPVLRARRWIERRPVVALALVLGLSFVTVTPGVLSWQAIAHARELAQERDRIARNARTSAAINDFLVDMIAGPDPYAGGARDLRLVDALDQSAARLGESFAGEPETEGFLRAKFARTYRHHGRREDARREAERAIALFASTPDVDPFKVLEARFELGSALLAENELAAAERELVSVRDALAALVGAEDRHSLETAGALALVWAKQGRVSDAERLSKATLECARIALGPSAPETLVVENNLAFLYMDLDRSREATPLLEDVLARRTALHGDDHPHTLVALSNLARALAACGEPVRAEELTRRSLDGHLRVLGETHAATLSVMETLGAVLLRAFLAESSATDASRARLAESERWFARAYQGCRQNLGAEDPQTLGAGSNLSVVLMYESRYGEAAELLEQLVAAAERCLPAGHWQAASFRLNLGSACLALGDLARAEPLIVENLRALEETLGTDHESCRAGRSLLARLRQRQGKSGDLDR